MEVSVLKEMTKNEVLDFIRLVLIKEGATSLKDHFKFDMSGYESKTGECTLKNLSVLNKFAFLGIYDYTTYLFLDFYKGTPILYFQYFHSEEIGEHAYGGLGTTDIIYEIFKLTIFSKKPTRRRS